MNYVLLIVLLMGFALLHMIKMMRLYLIVMDRQIVFERFVPAYLRTTLVNLIIPFKLGEVYRVGVFWRLSGGFKTGFFSVLIDRFFDTLALVIILLPWQFFTERRVSVPVMLLTAFLVAIVLMYVIFPSTFAFLNRYIITSKSSKRSMTALKYLEVMNGWYEYARMLVQGRYGILIIFSVVAWLLESFVFAGFVVLLGKGFNSADFGNYIDSIITGAKNSINNTYSYASIIVMAMATIILSLYYLMLSKRNKKNG